MNILETILFSLSKTPESIPPTSISETTTDNALDLLTRVYPDFDTLVSGKRVLDFGCGRGNQSIALVQKYGCTVVGVDSNRRILEIAIEKCKTHNMSRKKLLFVEQLSSDLINGFDVVISQNSFEHFRNPLKVLEEMRSLLNETGIILITFGPPWFAPYGSHMNFFCKVPWMNILFPEETVMKVRGRFRNDGAKRYEDVESGLNKMTVSKFEHIVSLANLEISYRNFECVKRLNLLSYIPFLRELFINLVTVILSKGK
jgi:ubiquinone/menaquinone biosynthesis C-methylase UbiE